MTVALRLTGLLVEADAPGTPARILERRFLGSVDLLTIAVDGLDRPLRARVRAGRLAESARDVFVSVDLRDVIVFEGRQGPA